MEVQLNATKYESNIYQSNSINSQKSSLYCNEQSAQIICPCCESKDYRKKGITKQKKQRYQCKECQHKFVLNPSSRGQKLADSEYVLTASQLGLQTHTHRSCTKLNLNRIKQDWFKEECKKFMNFKSNSCEFYTLNHFLSSFKTFSDFLEEIGNIKAIEDINRHVILDYLNYLKRKKICCKTRNDRLSHLKTFFEIGGINSWFNLPPYLIRQEDWQERTKSLPRYIPEEVMCQLNEHLDALPAPVMRMVLVIQECGLRIGEICQLPFDCLKQNTKSGYFIQFMRWKMKKEAILPISVELSKVIQEQQEYIRENLGKDYNYLFSGRKKGGIGGKEFSPAPKVMRADSFVIFLNKLTEEFDIKDNSGKSWHFQSHQFRHTVGTRMINNGVPQHIVQKYLGHESPEMTMIYAHIHDETLRKEIEKYHETRIVNFQGETTELEETVLGSGDDLEWFKKTVQARALEHGYCARPKLLGDCDIPGFDGCYNCPHWRTNKNFLPVLKGTLQRTENVLNKARNCGWELQVKKNEPVKANLEKVIKSLEAAS